MRLFSLAPGTPWRRAISRTKNLLFPAGEHVRRLPVGLGRGLELSIDLRYRAGLYLGFYEIELNRYFRLFCSPGVTAYDVGAQDGYHTLVIARLTGEKVVAFECDAAAYRTLGHSVAANPNLAPRIEVVQSFVTNTSDPSRGQLALDDFAVSAQGFVPGLIKMDIEGAEFDALHGAEEILSQRYPHLIVETHSSELETRCDEYLREFGYRPQVVNARSWAQDNRTLAHNRWLVARGNAPMTNRSAALAEGRAPLEAPAESTLHPR